MDRSVILKAFNDHFVEFVEDVQRVFPENTSIATAKNALLAIRKANPKLIIECWKKYVSDPYADKIAEGEFSFFTEKDYRNDLRNMARNDTIMQKIDDLRDQIRNMVEEDQRKSMLYVQNLVKLSNMY